MSQWVEIIGHLSVEELGDRDRHSGDVVERGHYQIIWLLAQGRSPAEVASATRYSRDWVYKLVRRYNQSGPSAIGDKRRQNRGVPTLLDAMQQAPALAVLAA